jgi:hypothetical protein
MPEGCLVDRGRIWLIGGTGVERAQQDAWYSNDGIQWHEAEFLIPYKHGIKAAVFGSQLMITGNSQNGRSIVSLENLIKGVQPSMMSPTRLDAYALVPYRDALWASGGSPPGMTIMQSQARGLLNDEVWYSMDGSVWKQSISASPTSFGARAWFPALEFTGKLWVISGHINGGGQANDIWCAEPAPWP